RSRYIQLFLQEGKAERVLSEDDFRRLRAMFTMGPNPDAVPGSVIKHFARSMAPPGRLTAALNYYRANLATSDAPWSRLSTVGPVTSPTHFLWGDQDPALGRRGAESTAEHVTGPYRFEVLEGAGHWLQFERPREVTQALVDAASK